MAASHDCAGRHCSCSLSLPSSIGRKRTFYAEEEENEEGNGDEEEGKEEYEPDDLTFHQRTNAEEKQHYLHGYGDGVSSQSFRESFYNTGTDWSALYDVDEYGIPIENPEIRDCKIALQVTERKNVLQSKLVQGTLSSCWESKGQKVRSVTINDVRKENVSDLSKKFDLFPTTIVVKLNSKASCESKSAITSLNTVTKLNSFHSNGDGISDGDADGSESSVKSFRESFYSSGTDWSTLYSVDEYDIPIENPEIGECKTALQVSERKEVLRGKLVQGTLSSCWESKGQKIRNVTIDVKKESISNFLKKFDLFPSNIVEKSSSKACASKSAMTSSTTVTKSDLKTSYVSKSAITSSSRTCPFYKKIPGTTFVVDAFRYGAVAGCSAYFLTHFHADHYGGLTKSWEHGPIYCTPITARLLALCLRVNERWICPIPLRTAKIIDGVQVRMLDANHCPGAAIILFQLKNGQFVLHTGDFRACKEMQSYPEFSEVYIDTLYLDTTYCNQKYRFPLQHTVIEFVVQVAQAALRKNNRTLIVVGAYSIGKERVYLGIAEALNVQIFVERRRSQILNVLEWPELLSKISTDSDSTLLHVLPIGYLRPQKLKAYLQDHPKFNSVLAFRPTGWSFSEKIGDQLHLLKPTISGCVTIYGVPYSEHSSFIELQEFVQFLKPQKIIPTVNVGRPQMRAQMESYFCQWLQKGVPNCRL